MNMKTTINNHNINILGKKASTSQNKEACSLIKQCEIGEIIYKGIFPSHQPKYKEKMYFETAEELSKDAYTTTIYLLEMNFIKTTQNFLKNSSKLR